MARDDILVKSKQYDSVYALLSDLKSCSVRRDLRLGRNVHAKAVENQYDKNSYVVTALINMYAKCGSMTDARKVFDSAQKPSVSSWNALLFGYADNGDGHGTLNMFSNMMTRGIAPCSRTYVAAFKACTSLAENGGGNGKEDCLKWGREIHSRVGCHLDRYVKNTLITMYAKCTSMVDARAVFDSVQNPNVVSWNALLLGYAEHGEGVVVLEMFSRMQASGCEPDSITYVAAVKACTSLAINGSRKEYYLDRGRDIHSQIGCHLDHYLQSTLIDMYAKCGSMGEALCVFDSIKKPDVVCWNALLLGYAKNGDGEVALETFSGMISRGHVPDSVTYVAALKACTSLIDGNGKVDCFERGREIHLQIGSHLNHYVQSTLIDMYAKCCNMVYARAVFDSIRIPDVASWNALILGYAENGDGAVALEMFSRMKASECRPDSVTYVAAVKACMSLIVDGNESDKEGCLKLGRGIHLQIGCNLDHYLQNTLIDMYAKCGSMGEAHHVFDSIQTPDVVSWNALLLGYANNGDGLVVLDMFSRMKVRECLPNTITYLAALKACILIGALALGRKFHLDINEVDAYLVTCLVDFYAKCGSIGEAREVFELHPKTRVISTWNALLAGYGSLGDIDSVFKIFEAMQDEEFQPDAVTFVNMLLFCSHAGLVEKGSKYFEAMAVQYGVPPTIMHYNCIIDILGRANQLSQGFSRIQKMSCNPNAVTWRTLLGACCKWKNVKAGRLAFQSLVDIDKRDASAYVVMVHLYGSVGMWVEQERVLETWQLEIAVC